MAGRADAQSTDASQVASSTSTDGVVGAGGAEPEPSPRRLVPRWFSFAVVPFTVAVAISMSASTYLYLKARNQAAGVPSSQAQMMGISDLAGRPAPAFALTDQHGRSVGLAQWRGKAVLLAFMDPRCTQICPVLAQELVLAERDLGRDGSQAAFVAINTDAAANSVGAIEQFTQSHGLAGLADWHFVTGTPPALAAVWKQYGISVALPAGADQSDHSAYLYFLDRAGRERFLADPHVDRRPDGSVYLPPASLAAWGHGIADYLRRSLAA